MHWNIFKAKVWLLIMIILSCLKLQNLNFSRQNKSGESNILAWYVLLFVTAARACELHGSNLAFHFNKKMVKPDLTPMFLFFGHGDLIFDLFFFRCDHPGDNRHYHPVLIFLRSSIFEPCHTTFYWKRPILSRDTKLKFGISNFDPFLSLACAAFLCIKP